MPGTSRQLAGLAAAADRSIHPAANSEGCVRQVTPVEAER
jgi:hypothetical protein